MFLMPMGWILCREGDGGGHWFYPNASSLNQVAFVYSATQKMKNVASSSFVY